MCVCVCVCVCVWRVQVRGLCGNMDGSMSNDWTSRSGIVEKQLKRFAMSYGVCVGAETTTLAHDLGLVVDTCSAADSAVTSAFMRRTDFGL